MAAGESGPPYRALRAEDLAAEPDAARWARQCAWVPGTGHCRNRGCGAACVFHEQRAAEARRVQRRRRLRRMFAAPRLR